MRQIPRIYYADNIIAVINSHISSGHGSYHMLPIRSKEKLTAMCMEKLGKDAYGYIIDSENLSATLEILSECLTEEINYKRACSLVKVMRQNAVEYAENFLPDLFEEIVENSR